MPEIDFINVILLFFGKTNLTLINAEKTKIFIFNFFEHPRPYQSWRTQKINFLKPFLEAHKSIQLIPVVHLEEFLIKKVSVRVFSERKSIENTPFLLKICILDTNFTHFNLRQLTDRIDKFSSKCTTGN